MTDRQYWIGVVSRQHVQVGCEWRICAIKSRQKPRSKS